MTGPKSPDLFPGDASSCDSTISSCPDAVGNLIATFINTEDNTRVAGLIVEIAGPEKSKATSDKLGQASFYGIKVGFYGISAYSACFTASATTSATVNANETVAIELQVHHIHAVLAIEELKFSGNNLVEQDTLGNFLQPEWQMGRAQAKQAPVAYARATRISCTPKFKITTAPCRMETVAVKGTATFGALSLEWAGTVTVNPGDTLVEAPTAFSSNKPLPNEVGIFDPCDITWQANPGNAGWGPAGVTNNVMYVTLGNPVSTNYWTLLDISCRAAAGKANENDFIESSFAPFAGRLGDGNGFKRKRDGTELTYYKFGSDTPSASVFLCSDLLSRADGTGRCGAWARFLVAMHEVHGVTSSKVIGVVPKSAGLLIVKNCTFSSTGSLPTPFTHKGVSECVKDDGLPGQGKSNPQFTFGDHALVQHLTGIYDPSYGVGPKPDIKTWEDGGIVGIGDGPPYYEFIYKGDKQIMPGKCCPGFIYYTAVAGDTLDSIATKFGTTSGSDLYHHPYNALFLSMHPAPAGSGVIDWLSDLVSERLPSVSPGDRIIIPREIASKVQILEKR